MTTKRGQVPIASPVSLSLTHGRLTSLRWVVTTLLACGVLVACAMGPTLTDHAFSFDARRESPTVKILDWRYGYSKVHGTQPERYSVASEDVQQMTSVNGPILRGDSLYVKWRIKDTGQTYEDTVDLASRLPADITDHRIHFVVKERQLYVYLISPERRPPSMPPNGPRKYDYLKVITIYPDQPRAK